MYDKCRETCQQFEEASFTSAIRIFAKLGENEKVRKTWDQARKECKLSHMLVASRIHAAADLGDVETAAAMLDLLNTSNLEVNAIVLTSAIRSCWGWGAKQHRAANYFWNLFPKFDSKPNIVAFTALIGAYMKAPLEDILVAKREMEVSGIKPDRAFAELYLATVVQQPDFKNLRGFDEVADALRKVPGDRVNEARAALRDFEEAGVELSGLCKKLKAALQRLEQHL